MVCEAEIDGDPDVHAQHVAACLRYFFVKTYSFSDIACSVVDPDPNWICIQEFLGSGSGSTQVKIG